MKGSKFNFFIPVELEKSKNEDESKNPYDNMVFWGEASDNSKDQEGEVLEPSGFDFSYLLTKGFMNLDHLSKRTGNPKFIIGEPIEAQVKDNKFYVKGKLYKDSQLARDFWDTIKTLKSSGSSRKPGMSIEGSAIERDPLNPKRITKACIRNVALTLSPVNANSWVDIVKGQQKEDYINNEEPDKIFKDGVLKEINVNGEIFYLMKNLTLVKAMNLEATAPVTSQSLDHKVKYIEDITKSLEAIKKAIEDGFLEKNDDLIKKIKKKFF